MAGNVCFGLLWTLLLLILVWPLAFFVSIFWICLMPCPCMVCCEDIDALFENLVTWPRECGKSIRKCSTKCPQPGDNQLF